VLDFLALEETQSTVYAIGKATIEKRMLENPGLRVGPVEEGYI